MVTAGTGNEADLARGRKRTQGSLVANDKSGTLGLQDLALLEISEQAGYGFPRGADHLRDFFVGQGELEARLLLHGFAVSRAPLDKQFGQLLGSGMREAKRADFVASNVVLFAELLGHLEASLAVFFEEAQEVVALDEIDLAGIDGFRGQLVGLAGNGGAETEDFAGLSDFEDEGLTVAGADRELYAALAKDENAAGCLAFDKQDGAFGISGGVLDALKGLQRGRRQIAEEALGAHLASKAAFDNVQTVW